MNLVRSVDPQMLDKTTLSCLTMILVGDLSPFLDDAVEVNSRLNPKKTTFLKVRDWCVAPNNTWLNSQSQVRSFYEFCAEPL